MLRTLRRQPAKKDTWTAKVIILINITKCPDLKKRGELVKLTDIDSILEVVNHLVMQEEKFAQLGHISACSIIRGHAEVYTSCDNLDCSGSRTTVMTSNFNIRTA